MDVLARQIFPTLPWDGGPPELWIYSREMNSYVVSDPVDVVEYFNRRSRVAEQDQEVIRLKKRVRILTAGRKVLKSVPGDGNCLVNAFLTSAQIPHTHVQARRNASNWLRENRDTRVQVREESGALWRVMPPGPPKGS